MRSRSGAGAPTPVRRNLLFELPNRLLYRSASNGPTFASRLTGTSSVNVLHHLALDEIVPRLVQLVAPGGRLIIQNVITREGLANFPMNLVAGLRRRARLYGGLHPHASIAWREGATRPRAFGRVRAYPSLTADGPPSLFVCGASQRRQPTLQKLFDGLWPV